MHVILKGLFRNRFSANIRIYIFKCLWIFGGYKDACVCVHQILIYFMVDWNFAASKQKYVVKQQPGPEPDKKNLFIFLCKK